MTEGDLQDRRTPLSLAACGGHVEISDEHGSQSCSSVEIGLFFYAGDILPRWLTRMRQSRANPLQISGYSPRSGMHMSTSLLPGR